MLDQAEPTGSPTRRMSEYSADVEMLSSINDRLAELIQTVIAVNGAKPRKIDHSPRPETALERVRGRHRENRHSQLIARVLPSKPSE